MMSTTRVLTSPRVLVEYSNSVLVYAVAVGGKYIVVVLLATDPGGARLAEVLLSSAEVVVCLT